MRKRDWLELIPCALAMLVGLALISMGLMQACVGGHSDMDVEPRNLDVETWQTLAPVPQRTLAVCRLQLGRGEEGCNNGGSYVASLKRKQRWPHGDRPNALQRLDPRVRELYWWPNRNMGPWCASGLSFSIEKAVSFLGRHDLIFMTSSPPKSGDGGAVAAGDYFGVSPRVWETKRHRAKWLGQVAARRFGQDDEPVVGSIAVWHRGPPGSPSGHVGIVAELDPHEGSYWTIEFNRGPFPARVRLCLHYDRPLYFARLGDR